MEIIITLVFLLFILLKSPLFKKAKKHLSFEKTGTKAEQSLVDRLLKYGIPRDAIYHNLYLRKASGEFSQIDLVMLTDVGIVVFEVKDFSGWIFGNGNSTQWVKILAYGKQKYKFYNPIKQNNNHIKELRKLINENIPFYSIIVFYGKCELKEISFVPQGTYVVYPSKVSSILDELLRTKIPANYLNKPRIINILKEASINGQSDIIKQQHVKNINRRAGLTDN